MTPKWVEDWEHEEPWVSLTTTCTVPRDAGSVNELGQLCRITANEIRDEVNRLLAEAFPGVTVHIRLSAGDFQRPAFYLEADHQQPGDVNFCTVEEKLDLLIKYLGVLDEQGRPDAQELGQVRDRLLALFPLGRLQVEDRSVRCALNSGIDLDGAWLELSCTWWDRRPTAPPPEVMRELTITTRG